MARLVPAAAAAALLARCLWPPVLPALVCLAGLTHGGEKGAKCGLLGGAFALCLGFSTWQLPLLTLLGGMSGSVFHNSAGVWGKCIRALPLLAGYALLPALGHWLAGEALIPCLTIAGREFLGAALTVAFLCPLWPKRRS